jgi:hypothetical protein
MAAGLPEARFEGSGAKTGGQGPCAAMARTSASVKA